MKGYSEIPSVMQIIAVTDMLLEGNYQQEDNFCVYEAALE